MLTADTFTHLAFLAALLLPFITLWVRTSVLEGALREARDLRDRHCQELDTLRRYSDFLARENERTHQRLEKLEGIQQGPYR